MGEDIDALAQAAEIFSRHFAADAVALGDLFNHIAFGGAFHQVVGKFRCRLVEMQHGARIDNHYTVSIWLQAQVQPVRLAGIRRRLELVDPGWQG